MGWDSIGIVFDDEPTWQNLEPLHPDAHLRGYRHKNGQLWLLEVWLDEREVEHYAFQSLWPERFVLPAGLSLPDGYARFLEEVSQVSRNVRTFNSNVVAYGLAVATLAGKRAYLWGGSDEDFNLAMVIHKGEVCAFGADGGMMNITWDGGQFLIQCTHDPDEPDYEPAEKELALLEALPFTRVIRESIRSSNVLYQWPVSIWPAQWGDVEQVLGLGTWDYSDVWDRELEVCYDRPGRAVPPTESPKRKGLLKRLFGV